MTQVLKDIVQIKRCYTLPLELNKNKLGRNRYLIEVAAYTLPAGNEETVDKTGTEPRTIEYPLFGETYSTVTILDHTLKGVVFYLKDYNNRSNCKVQHSWLREPVSGGIYVRY
ncbi:MAG: hypothetical protein WD355_05780 [Balneolaceae bacterium]